jgi:hypothetical protein
MSTTLWIVETAANVFLFAYIGLLLWLYFCSEDGN